MLIGRFQFGVEDVADGEPYLRGVGDQRTAVILLGAVTGCDRDLRAARKRHERTALTKELKDVRLVDRGVLLTAECADILRREGGGGSHLHV